MTKSKLQNKPKNPNVQKQNYLGFKYLGFILKFDI